MFPVLVLPASHRCLLFVAAPPSAPVIHNANGVEVGAVAGPFQEGYDLQLSCSVTGGETTLIFPSSFEKYCCSIFTLTDIGKRRGHKGVGVGLVRAIDAAELVAPGHCAGGYARGSPGFDRSFFLADRTGNLNVSRGDEAVRPPRAGPAPAGPRRPPEGTLMSWARALVIRHLLGRRMSLVVSGAWWRWGGAGRGRLRRGRALEFRALFSVCTTPPVPREGEARCLASRRAGSEVSVISSYLCITSGSLSVAMLTPSSLLQVIPGRR